MKQKTENSKMLRQRKFLLAFPLITLPFLTLMFWSLGGGKVQKSQAGPFVTEGFNFHLPDAHLRTDKQLDKLSYYEKASSDSAKLQELNNNDPTYHERIVSKNGATKRDGKVNGYRQTHKQINGLITSPYKDEIGSDSNEVRVYRKLAELNQALSKEKTSSEKQSKSQTSEENGESFQNTGDLESLEKFVSPTNQNEEHDPELKQINGLLEKILDVQHPDRVQEKIRKASETQKGQVFAVSAVKKETPVSILGRPATIGFNRNTSPGQKANGFYSLNQTAADEESSNAIQAVVHQSQTLVSGSTVKLRLLSDVFINGVLIPKDNFLFGQANLNGERLDIKISSIRYQNSLFPVELSVYDQDGLEGIYIPGAITRDVAKQSADRAIQGLGLMALDPSWQAQAAGAGIEAAKNLISKKVKLIRVSVKAGYQVLLKDEKQKQGI